MKITVDRAKCEGYGKCIQVAAKVFKFDEKFICEVIDPKADSDERFFWRPRCVRPKRLSWKRKTRAREFSRSFDSPRCDRFNS
jgi:hypothetical protein